VVRIGGSVLMPILGIMASSITASTLGDYESIATVLVGSGGASNIEFTAIPSTFQHLQLRISAQNSDNNQGFIQGSMQLNGDTAGNYSWHRLLGNGASTFSSGEANASSITLPHFSDQEQSVNYFNGLIIDILDYTDTNKYTTTRSLGGTDQNGQGVVGLYSGNWRNTNAVTSVKLLPSGVRTFTQHTIAALYGIKG
jgi:hypothetical protein